MSFIEKEGLIAAITNTESEVVKTAPYDQEWFTRLADRQFEIINQIEAFPVADVQPVPPTGIGDLSDGYHTFNGLYHQRMVLFAALVKAFKDRAWKSYRHDDGELCFGGGWFIVGIDTPDGSYTYHYETKDWALFDCVELEAGKHWDGHTEDDVTRLLSLPAADVAERERLGEQIYRAVHSAGACDPDSDYDRGYDDGLAAALEEITRLTGIDENCLDEERMRTMSDYISREAAVEKAMEYCTDDDGSCSKAHTDLRELLDDLENLPAADVRPVVHGKWIDIMVGEMLAQACDQCKTFYPLAYTGGGHHFCPNCGADMREVEDG